MKLLPLKIFYFVISCHCCSDLCVMANLLYHQQAPLQCCLAMLVCYSLRPSDCMYLLHYTSCSNISPRMLIWYRTFNSRGSPAVQSSHCIQPIMAELWRYYMQEYILNLEDFKSIIYRHNTTAAQHSIKHNRLNLVYANVASQLLKIATKDVYNLLWHN